MSHLRNIWTTPETTALLEIFREREIYKMFDGKRRKNAEIYQHLQEEMRRKGYINKTAEQIKNKWKSLKAAYSACLRESKKSGAERKECEYFEELHEILGSQPSAATEGVDTTSTREQVEQVLEDIVVDVSPDVTTEEFGEVSPVLSTSYAEDSPSPSSSRTTYRRKRRAADISLENFIEQQRSLMEDFFKREELREELASKRRREELQTLVSSFSAAVDRLLTLPVYPSPAMPPQQYPGDLVSTPLQSLPRRTSTRSQDSSENEIQDNQE